ncbi:TPA: DUF2157 domain-containing protein [Yersinia enterocolitica]|uniref:Uncharacterized protein n=3 Tax=Yersinia enterocolitica TaxID=630 RepID=A0A0H3NUP2_YERE1|nr:DUF2157 domain-containing protein [Yersinia enterocolitica]ADZ43555.1 putative integral membrane protein [Yersinia enterocolitica subsp. palearctica 105.5R(r)]AJJ28802.1 putative membrane protein [Yersinia enterocolitica]ALG79643.1 membrane protein [Yersinia enterocolitica]EKN3314055.1 DUF2157 domain-containing protein [Yersinia enterocolitica]EKN3317570.1 DUF2157 domain-containing protein [Yersinia enterocolitica]
MKLNKKSAVIVHKTLDGWAKEGVIPEDERQRLLEHIDVQPFDWRRLAGYAFLAALASLVIAIGSLMADTFLLAWISQFFRFDPPVRVVVTGILAATFYGWGFYRRRQDPSKIYSNEAVLFLGVIFTAAAIGQLGEWLDNGSGRISVLLLLGTVIYGVVGWFGRSPLVWLFALLSLGNAFGAETGYLSGWGAYWLGMSYPVRFIAFGLLLCASALTLQPQLASRRLDRVSQAMGLLYLFIALWLLSIFGNYGDIDHWYQVRQIELMHWSLLFALAAAAAIWLGLKRDDAMLRGFGLTFLAINLYTRFFEFFWDTMPKTIFFLLLGISLWLLGRHAERVWRLGHHENDVIH